MKGMFMIILGQSLSPSVMTVLNLVRMGSVQLLLLNWTYL